MYSWTGNSKENKKQSFGNLKNINKFFYEIIKSVDKSYTTINQEDFFKNSILKYSEIRAAPRETSKRKSTPRVSLPKKKRLVLNFGTDYDTTFEKEDTENVNNLNQTPPH